MSKDGPVEEIPLTKEEYLKGILAGNGNISPQTRAIILQQQCQAQVGSGTKKYFVHDPEQVFGLITKAVNSAPNEKKDEIFKKATEVLKTLFEISPNAYDGLTSSGTQNNRLLNSMLEGLKSSVDEQIVNNTKVELEAHHSKNIGLSSKAQSNTQSYVNNDKSTDIAAWVANLRQRRIIGGYSKSTFNDMASVIANDLKQYQVNSCVSRDSSEAAMNQHSAFFNAVSNKVVNDILTAQNLRDAANMHRLYIKVAKQCVKNGDFDSAFNIGSALGNPAITRMKEDLLSGQPKQIRKDLHNITQLISPIDTFRKLKTKMGEHEGAFTTVPASIVLVPYTNGNEQPEILNNGSFNADKPVMLAKAFEPLVKSRQEMRQQNSETSPQAQTNFVQDVFHSPRLDDKQLYDVSLRLKPRDQQLDASQFNKLNPAPNLSALIVDDDDPDLVDDSNLSIELVEPADTQAIEVAPNMDDDNVIYIGPEQYQEQKIDQKVPPLNLSQVQREEDPSPKMERGVPKLDLGQVERVEDPSPQIERGVPKLDLSQVERLEDPSPKIERGVPKLDLKQVEPKSDPSPKVPRQGPEQTQDEGQHRQKKQDKQQPEGRSSLGSARHMTTQFTQMLERQRQKSQQDVSPTLQQRVEQSQKQEAPQQKQESTRPSRGKVGGLTSMFEAKIKQMEQEAQSSRVPKQADDAPKQRTGRGNKR